MRTIWQWALTLCVLMAPGSDAVLGHGRSAWAQSVITSRIEDAKAVYIDPTAANGDSTAALQAAIDKAATSANEGIVFLPAARYKITRTVYVWPGVRVIGYGATRPILMLPPRTPGFDGAMGVMVMFTGLRPAQPQRPGFRVPFPPPGMVAPNDKVADANSGTFYSAMSNVDVEIGEGNPGAVAVRFHVAQHAFLSHMEFRLGDGMAGLYQVGNEAEDLHFIGGRYGILSEKTSPAWQFTLLDSSFDGQREAAVREHEAALTLVRTSFRDVPTAIQLDDGYPEQLWVKDSRFERVANAAVVISLEQSPLTQIGFENTVLSATPVFARLRDSGRTIEGHGAAYRVKEFNYGLLVPGEGRMGSIGVRYNAEALNAMPAPVSPAIRALPPSAEWVNVRSLGVKGDGATDDTAAIRHAVAEHRVLYFPSGHYVVRDTIELKPDTILIGLHPTLTQIDLLDETPGFDGVGAPKPILLAPKGGTNIMSGFGVFTGGINPRATAVLWKAGESSLMDDVRFLGGHGSGTNPYNNDHTADPDLKKRWDGQYPSLWITDGGGGSFANIWTPNTFAQSGFLVSYTKTPGHVYELSNEHHVRVEIQFDHAENWDVNAPQTEEEAGESPEALSLEIRSSRNLTFANYHAYRVTRTRAPYETAVRVYDSSEIHFRNVHVNAESGYATCDKNGCGTFLRVSRFPYENALVDMTRHEVVRDRAFAVLDIPNTIPLPQQPGAKSVLAKGGEIKKLEDGFFSISGGAVDAKGKLYFVDHHLQRIFSWTKDEGLRIVQDNPLDPVNLAVDESGNLMVLSSAGSEATVYTFRPGTSAEKLKVLQPQATHPGTRAQVLLPVNWWNNGEFKDQLDPKAMRFKTLAELFAEDMTTPRPREYVSVDGSVVLPMARVFQQGPANDISGWRFSDTLDTYGFVKAKIGEKVYVASSSENLTYVAQVNEDGTLGNAKPFARRGGESVAVDAKGNVYVADGQIFVYSPNGTQVEEIDVPERPLQLLFGGPEGKTLFVMAHHGLFAAEVR